MPIKGGRRHLDRLAALSGNGAMVTLGRALFVAGDLVRTTAQQKITTGAQSGKGHRPSRPGEAPNQDTGVLGNNIETVQVKPLVVEVSSNAAYAASLEFGTDKMAERPYMRPARDETKPEVVRIVNVALNKVVRQSRSKRSD